MKKLVLMTLFLSSTAMATDTLDCGNDFYHFTINVGHENDKDLVTYYYLYKNDELIVKNSNFTSSISWLENDLESKINTLYISDLDNTIELSISKDIGYLIINGVKQNAHCDWVR